MSWFFKEAHHAQLYRKYRLTYPPELFNCILSNLAVEKVDDRWQTALDIGCGTGQGTLPLVSHFSKVIGIDVSEAQIKEANQLAADMTLTGVEFRVGVAHDLSFQPNDSVDLITVAEAAHYFDLDAFFKEARRVLRKNGVLAIYGYFETHLLKPEAEVIMKQFQDLMDGYLDERCSRIKDGYKEVFASMQRAFPVSKRDDTIKMVGAYDVETFVCYLKTWSCYQRFLQENSGVADPLVELQERLSKVYETDGVAEKVHFSVPVFLLMGIKSNDS